MTDTETKPELSIRQHRILEVVEDFVSTEGIAPTIREVARLAGCAVSTAAYHLKVLEAAGLLSRGGSRTARTLRVVKQP